MEAEGAALIPTHHDAQKAEIIRIASYHMRDFDIAVAHTNLRENSQIRDLLLQTCVATSSTLGDLESLPLEILHEICLLLDLRSLFNFRHINHRAKQIVRATRGFEALVTHATGALCVILKTTIASWFTLPDLFETFCTRDCYLCRSFGGFIFLPLFTRCCFSCIRENRLPSTLSISAIKKRFKLSTGPIYSLVPTVRSLPGVYSLDEVAHKKRTQIIPTHLIRRFVLSEKRPATTQLRETALSCYMTTTSLPYLNLESGDVQDGICCAGCQIALENHLKSSRPPGNACDLRDKVYSFDEFISHFGECHEAKALWNSSKEGIDVSKMSEFVRRRGGFKNREADMSFTQR